MRRVQTGCHEPCLRFTSKAGALRRQAGWNRSLGTKAPGANKNGQGRFLYEGHAGGQRRGIASLFLGASTADHLAAFELGHVLDRGPSCSSSRTPLSRRRPARGTWTHSRREKRSVILALSASSRKRQVLRSSLVVSPIGGQAELNFANLDDLLLGLGVVGAFCSC